MSTKILCRPSAIMATALLFALSACQLCAQEAKPSQPPTPHVDIQFGGGIVGGYIEAVRQQAPDLSIVTAPGVMNLHVGAIEVKNLSAINALNVLESLLGGKLRVIYRNNFVSIYAHRETPVLVVESIGNLIAEEAEARGRLGKIRLEDLLTAVNIGLSLVVATEDHPVIKVHPETGLLMATGSRAAVKVVKDVILNLRTRQDAEDKRYNVGKNRILTARIKDLEKTIQEKDLQIKKMTAQSKGERY